MYFCMAVNCSFRCLVLYKWVKFLLLYFSSFRYLNFVWILTVYYQYWRCLHFVWLFSCLHHSSFRLLFRTGWSIFPPFRCLHYEFMEKRIPITFNNIGQSASFVLSPQFYWWILVTPSWFLACWLNYCSRRYWRPFKNIFWIASFTAMTYLVINLQNFRN